MTYPTTASKNRYDAVIVGARCAGAATAMLLARRGLDVLVVDRAEYGSDALSTHALMRGAVVQLHRWGLLDAVRASGAAAVRQTVFQYGDERVTIPIKEDYGVDALYAPRRKVLDRILVDAARRAGAEVRFGCVARDVLRSADGAVTGLKIRDREGRTEEVSAGMVVGADGAGSTIARKVGAETLVQGRHAAAVVFGYFRDLPAEGYHWGFGERATYGVIPTNDGASLVFAAVPKDRYAETFAGDMAQGFTSVLQAISPELAGQVRAAEQTEGLRGFTGMPGFIRQPYGPGWALVGDAAYFRDPATAHGITDAFRDAEWLARAIVGENGFDLADYRNLRDAAARPLFDVTEAIAACNWSFDELKRHHADLNSAMKAELALLATTGLTPAPARPLSRTADAMRPAA